MDDNEEYEVVGELTDYSIPQQRSSFDVSKEVPAKGIEDVVRTRRVPGTHDQETRKLIALIILALVSFLYLAIVGFFLFKGIDTTMFTAAIAGISGVQALASAAIGFYYGSKQSDRS